MGQLLSRHTGTDSDSLIDASTASTSTAPTKSSTLRSRQIDRFLKRERNKNSRVQRRQVKVLLLGAGESGKSTILKQMKILHLNGFTRSELDGYRTIVVRNVLESIRNLIHAIDRFAIPYEREETRASAQGVLAVAEDLRVPVMTPALAEMISAVWTDGAALKAMKEHGSEFYMMDTAPYFFDQLERIGDEEYIPTEADVLRTRVKSTGITETRFSVDRLDIRMFDVGGQRSERKKWIHCFEGVTSVIFVVAVNEYDQVLLEEEQQNRMSESLILFETIVLSKWFQRSSIILFFNKIDLFAEKIKRIPLANYFPEYAGKDDFGKACKFMIWRFQQANKPNLPLYPHLTCATDTDQMFTSVKDTLLNNALRDTGML